MVSLKQVANINFPIFKEETKVLDDYFQDQVVTNKLIYTCNISIKISQINYYKTGHFDVAITLFLAQFHTETALSSEKNHLFTSN
jgi:hypothetical protein